MANELFEKARLAREKAYSPYSQHKVGAAIKTAKGAVFVGCNVENSSYGGTICAERTAVVSAVASEGGRIAIEEVCVVTDASPPWSPCGFCRQVIAEFAKPETPIVIANLKGEVKRYTLRELLPHAFTPEQ